MTDSNINPNVFRMVQIQDSKKDLVRDFTKTTAEALYIPENSSCKVYLNMLKDVIKHLIKK